MAKKANAAIIPNVDGSFCKRLYLNVLEIVKKEPRRILSLFIKYLLNYYYYFHPGQVLSLRYLMREFFMV